MKAPRNLIFALVLVPCLGCATKRLPPGTPPPEYEKRAFEPWSQNEPDAGADAQASAAPPAGSAPTEAVPPSPDQSDAGPSQAP